jgi:hypothetical protein
LRRPLGIIAHRLKLVARAILGLPAKALFGAANPLARLLAASGHPIERRGRSTESIRFATSDELVQHHFETRSDPTHVNFSSLHETLSLLREGPSLIIETGSSAWGTDSSRLFDTYVASFGGKFHSVDIRLEPMFELRSSLTTRSILCCDDSVRFLRRWVAENPGRRADLVYLDSWDLDVFDPVKAATHGLEEFFAVAPALRDGSLLLIDDTPADADWFPIEWREAARDFHSRYGLVPGKGMLVDRYLEGRDDVAKVHHRYQVLYQLGAHQG